MHPYRKPAVRIGSPATGMRMFREYDAEAASASATG